MTWASMMLVGRVTRPHGLRGHMVVEPDTDFGAARFAPGAQVWREVAGEASAVTVCEGRQQGTRWVIRVEGVTSIEAAEMFRGKELRIPEDAKMALGSDEYYLHDLVGCLVQTTLGEDIGRVQAVYTAAGGALLGIDHGGSEVLVPLVKAICPEVDVVGKRIRLDPPEGLLDVNRPRESDVDRPRDKGDDDD